MDHSDLMREVGRLVRALVEYRPWGRSNSLGDGPDWMPDPLTLPPPPSIPTYRRRAGVPMAAPVPMIHSARGSSNLMLRSQGWESRFARSL